jgi:formate-nitrite transporter family protein
MSGDLGSEKAPGTEPKKGSQEILRDEIREGRDVLERPGWSLAVSGLSAGLDIGFSLFLMAVVRTLLGDGVAPWLVHLLVANMYAVGFIFVVLGRSELFTEQTTLAVLPVLGGRASLAALFRAWAIVLASNLLGAAAFAAITVAIGPALGVIELRTLGDIAHGVTDHPAGTVFASAVLAGWLMGLLSWLVAAARDTISQFVIVWLIATVIGIARLHHVVVGSVEVFAGIFAGQGVTFEDYGTFALWTALGNVVGGTVFVAVIKFGHTTLGATDAGRLS